MVYVTEAAKTGLDNFISLLNRIFAKAVPSKAKASKYHTESRIKEFSENSPKTPVNETTTKAGTKATPKLAVVTAKGVK